MLILLPPSEGKASPSQGRPLDLDSLLGGTGLSATRLRAMEALSQASARPDAAALLGLGPRSAADAALNLHLATAPCAPAHELFTGVLYGAAALAHHASSQSGRRVLGNSVVILSGLWGAVRATDALPDHRLSMGVALPGLGRMSTFWKGPLAPVLDALAGGVVVDCRSSAYAAAWQPSAQAPAALLRVAVVKEAPDGRRTVVSHHAKHTRGLLVGALITALAGGALIQEADAEAVAAIAQGLEGVDGVELGEPDRRGRRDLRLVLH